MIDHYAGRAFSVLVPEFFWADFDPLGPSIASGAPSSSSSSSLEKSSIAYPRRRLSSRRRRRWLT
jgi:hypothetical protein